MYKILIIPVIVCILLQSAAAVATDRLLFLEAQGVYGYSSALGKTIPYSMNSEAEMQKPSVGFDYLQRFSGDTGDVATLAIQARLALSHPADNEYELEPQLYNAYLKIKTPIAYVWIGHNRPAFGLGSYFDSHGLLLRTLSVQGFGYDRDWGAGVNRDFSWGDFSASATLGSGMPIRENGENYMTAARVSYGVLARDNYNLGLSLGAGQTLDTMGYTLMDDEPRSLRLAGADMTVLRDNMEHRFDVLAGKWLDKDGYALFYRFGINLDQEGQWKIEAQPTYWKFDEDENYQLALCASFLATSNLTIRTAYVYDDNTGDNRFLVQLYYYRPM